METMTIKQEIESYESHVRLCRKRCQCHANSTGRAKRTALARLAANEIRLAGLRTDLAQLNIRNREDTRQHALRSV